MLECLALEDSCINDTWNWIYANWSWGFFIAVLSLWFTAKALKKTDKANNLAEVSLELTRESTRIAEESLQAAKESIDTSVELYEKQKKDDDDSKEKTFCLLKRYINRKLIELSHDNENLSMNLNLLCEYKAANDKIEIYSLDKVFVFNCQTSANSSTQIKLQYLDTSLLAFALDIVKLDESRAIVYKLEIIDEQQKRINESIKQVADAFDVGIDNLHELSVSHLSFCIDSLRDNVKEVTSLLI